MDDERAIDIETKLAHQEHTIAALNDALTSQQAQIIALENRVRALAERIRAIPDTASPGDTANEPPPHY